MTTSRTQYSTDLKMIYATGLEKFALSFQQRKNIPPTTVSSWRKIKDNHFYGHENATYYQNVLKDIGYIFDKSKLYM